MSKEQLLCAHCGHDIPFSKKLIKQHYMGESNVIITKPELCCYIATCPKCKRESSYNKDYVKDLWKLQNSNIMTAQKL